MIRARIYIDTPDDRSSVCILVEPARLTGNHPWAVETELSALTIPPRYRHGIAQIGELSDASFSDLVVALKKFPEADTAAKLAGKIAPEVKSISKTNLTAIVSALAAMQSIKNSVHVTAETFSVDLWDALHEDSPELAEGLEEGSFKTRAKQLLTDTVVHLSAARMAEVRREVERLFCGARILTDVRPGFAEDATKTPGMTVMQTLQITFHDDLGRHREFYVSLDDNDIATLKHVIERAIVKKQTLHRLLKKSDFDLYE